MNAVLAGLRALGAARLAALALVGVATLGLFAVLTLRGSNEPMVLLYAELDTREAGQIAEQLDRQHIPHQMNSRGDQILVPADQVSPARLLLARQGLPSGGSIGYEIFDRGDGFTANQFQQNINQLRALEGELSRTIRGINGIRAARVHLVLPKREPFARDRQEAQASVMLTTAGAGRLDRESVQAIVNLVAAAVPGLRAQAVTVIDSRGTLLARAGDPNDGAQTSAHLDDIRHGAELRLDRAVEEMLEPSLGAGHVRAEATIDMDFDRINQSDEKFDPDGQVVRSTQTNNDTNKSTEASPTVSVQNNLPNADAGTSGAAGSQEQKQQETTNYEIGKSVRTLVHDQPQIKRISLAVLVDGTESTGADGKTTWQPRPAEEVERITRLVKTAVGFDEKRGDQIQVESMRFAAATAEAVPAAPGLLGLPIEKADLMRLGQTLLIGLVAVIALLLVFRPMILRLTTLPAAGRLGGRMAAAGLIGSDVSLQEMENEAAAEAGPAVAAPGRQLALPANERPSVAESMINLANIEGQLRASSLRQLTELVDKHPEESLSIVRTWMQQDAA